MGKKCECVEKHVISKLPYTITKPGHYCLGKSFTWSDNTQSAITILNTNNVVLSFNQRKITTTLSSTFAVVQVVGSTDVKLNDVDLESTANPSRGLEILANSSNIKISKPILTNFSTNLAIYNSSTIVIECPIIKNVVPASFGVDVLMTNDVTIKNGHVVNSRIRFSGPGERVYMEGTFIDNSAGSGTAGRAFQTFDYDIVHVYKNHLKGRADTLVLSGPFPGFVTFADASTSFIVEDNIIESFNGGMVIQLANGYTIRNNQITLLQDGPFVTGIVVFTSLHGLIDNNNVSGVFEPLTTSQGISIFKGSFVTPTSHYNTVKNNFVSGFGVGYADHFHGTDNAKCTTFAYNVGTGNLVNFGLIDPSTIDVNNISGCEAIPQIQAQSVQIVEKKIVEP